MHHHGATWPVILLLGVWHGVNPGMGWLFAVALGMQERGARAVWRALPPLAAGHALAIAAALAFAAALGLMIPLRALQWGTAAILVGTGLYRLFRHGHGRYAGMQVGSGALALWSMFMASAHGAGLMVVPFVLGTMSTRTTGSHMMHSATMLPGSASAALGATAMHTAGYLLTAGVIAVVVYRWVGLRFLRKYWVNLDLVWAIALIVTGLVTPLL